MMFRLVLFFVGVQELIDTGNRFYWSMRFIVISQELAHCIYFWRHNYITDRGYFVKCTRALHLGHLNLTEGHWETGLSRIMVSKSLGRNQVALWWTRSNFVNSFLRLKFGEVKRFHVVWVHSTAYIRILNYIVAFNRATVLLSFSCWDQCSTRCSIAVSFWT